MEWISIKDRLPKFDSKVLVFHNGSYGKYPEYVLFVHDMYRFDSKTFPKKKYNRPGFIKYDDEWGYYESTDVTHWMELEPPKEEDKC